jgi:hypothetical protein
MLDERSIRAAMTEARYERLKRHVYRAKWSTLEAEHFVYFHLYGTPKEYLTADFGFKNQEAEQFAVKSIQAYGGKVYEGLHHEEHTDCYMRFELGRLASWGIRSSLRVSMIPAKTLQKKIAHDITQVLFPIIGEVTSLDRLLWLLLADGEPYPWIRCNGAMRAAMVVHLAQRVGMPVSETRARLEPYQRSIATNILKAPDPDPRSYVERIINDASLEASMPLH